MKVKVLVIFLVVISIILFVYTSCTILRKIELSRDDSREIANNIIDKWYLVSENTQYMIYTSGVRGRNIVVVLDKNSNELLVPDNSCEVTISKDLTSDANNSFYNSSVGIKVLGPYKSIHYDTERDVFKQAVQNAGCLSEEGIIELSTNENPGTVSCDITIRYKNLGC